MRITLETNVEQDLDSVFAQFTEQLLLQLTPPLMRVKMLRFDGSKVGDVVQLQLYFLYLLPARWTSTISEAGSTADEHYFVDAGSGKDLPFPLRSWQHRHRIVRDHKGSKIIDDIQYQTLWGFNWLMYPFLWLQFAWRKPIYRKLFKL